MTTGKRATTRDKGSDPGPPKLKRRRVRVKTGQLVGVPLLDGTYALVHVALYDISIIAAHFAHRKNCPEELLESIEETMRGSLIAMVEVTSDEIRNGRWPVIGEREATYPETMLDMKGRSYVAALTRSLFNAYYGLEAWDQMADPHFFEKMMLPGVPVPPTVRYKRDFANDAVRLGAPPPPAPTEDAAAPPVTDGPAVIHIEIRYAGEALPSVELLHRRQALERALEAAGAGTVTDAGGGGGVMDIYLETEDVRVAMLVAKEMLEQSGFGKDAKIDASAVEGTAGLDE